MMDKFMYAREESCAFTGHRSIRPEHEKVLRGRLRQAIEEVYNTGVTNFVCGMAVGFDMMAAETVLALRDELPDITLTAVVPFRGQEDRWSETNKRRYRRILEEADSVIVLSDRFFRGAELRHNDYMIDHACRVIAYYDGGPKSGTGYTVTRARDKDLSILNLFD